ncbi:MAG: hypothetical protein C5B55_11780, partial [Blastocatellia bacterium]
DGFSPVTTIDLSDHLLSLRGRDATALCGGASRTLLSRATFSRCALVREEQRGNSDLAANVNTTAQGGGIN